MKETLRRAVVPAAWLLVAACLALTAAAKWFWPQEVVQGILVRSLTPWLRFEALLAVAAVVAATVRARAGIRAARSWLAGALMVAVMGPLAAWYLAPPGHKLYFDEDIYAQVGVSMALDHRAGILDLSLPDPASPAGWRGERWTLNKEPSGYPLLVSLGVPFFGVDDHLGARVSLCLFGLGILGLALFVRESPLVAGRPLVPFLAAAAYALWPENLRWAVCAVTEPSAAALASWTLFLASRAGRTRHPVDRLAACSVGAIAAQMRPEGVLLLLPVALLLFGLPARPWSRSLLARARPVVPWVALMAVLLCPHGIHIASAAHEDWGAKESKFTTSVLAENVVHNVGYWFSATPAGRNTPPPPRAWFPLAVIGAIVLLVQANRLRAAAPKKIGAAPAEPDRGEAPESPPSTSAHGLAWSCALFAWGGLFFAIFLPFYAGSYHYGIDVRFSLLVVPVYVTFAVVGADALVALVARTGSPARIVLSLLLLALPLAAPLAQVPVITDEAWQARADHAAVAVMARQLPADAVVVSHTPFQWAMHGVAAVQVTRAWPEPGLVVALQARGPVYYHHNYWDVMPVGNGSVEEAVTIGRLFRAAYETDTAYVVEARNGITYALLALKQRRVPVLSEGA